LLSHCVTINHLQSDASLIDKSISGFVIPLPGQPPPGTYVQPEPMKTEVAELAVSPSNALDELVNRYPRMRFARLPTQIHRLDRLSDELGCSIYCKRDDLTGFGFGGNKIRKLEFLVREAVDAGADAIVTCGSNQSNWCRTAAVTGAAANLEVHLVLGGGTPATLTGNLLLNARVGAHMHHLATDSDPELEAASEELATRLCNNGISAHRILMGGSNGLGTLGYADAFREILQFERSEGVRFSAIVFATGSGGTQAGLVVGQVLSGWDGRIIGMAASRDSDAQVRQVRNVLDRFERFTGIRIGQAPIVANGSYVGEGYRKRTAACEEAIDLFARTEGIFLDQVYTGKAAAGLIDHARKGRFGADENILFIHTGGTVQLFE